MDLALRLSVALLVIAGPTVLFLGLMRVLEWARDDALIERLAADDDAPDDVSDAAAGMVRTGPIRTDGRGRGGEHTGPRSESVACSSCGAENMAGARYCGTCLKQLR